MLTCLIQWQGECVKLTMTVNGKATFCITMLHCVKFSMSFDETVKVISVLSGYY